ncbi:MAG: trans-sulfuration enzyme family protein [Candidatus Eiseniibacteriota bacterium]
MSRDREHPPSAPGTRTRAVHGEGKSQPGGMNPPLVRSATFAFESLEAMNAEQARGRDSSYYQRVAHPTVRACERHLAKLEGAEDALLFASGMAAISAVLFTHVSAGDHVVALEQSYGGTHEALRFGAEHFGWRVTFVDGRRPGDWPAAFTPQTKLFHVESPTNPMNLIVDLAAAAALAHAHGAKLSVDNTFASPIGQHPLALGADVVAYSATKSIGGHSDLVAGAVTASAAVIERVWKVRKLFGGIAAPEVAALIERSLKTLPLRVAAQNETALELARHLEVSPGVVAVWYPGLGTHPGHAIADRQMMLGFGPVVAFEVAGGGEGARRTAEALRLVSHAPSLGSAESLVSLPAHTSHIQLGPDGRARAGIPEGLVRLSVGLEDVEDLRRDLDQALARAIVPNAAAAR